VLYEGLRPLTDGVNRAALAQAALEALEQEIEQLGELYGLGRGG